MINLSDTQAILLSTAAQRADRSVFPLPASLRPGGGATKAIGALVKHGFAEERETSDITAVYRNDDDRRLGLFITPAGAAAIGVTLGETPAQADGVPIELTSAVAGKAPAKTTLVLDLLHRPTGVTMAEIIALTGWLPHTTRAALTGLRKKGHAITRSKRGDATCYRLVAE